MIRRIFKKNKNKLKNNSKIKSKVILSKICLNKNYLLEGEDLNNIPPHITKGKAENEIIIDVDY